MSTEFHTFPLNKINPAKREILHSFKGQQLENKSLYCFVIYIGLWKKILALIFKFVTRELAEIHDDLSENMQWPEQAVDISLTHRVPKSGLFEVASRHASTHSYF